MSKNCKTEYNLRPCYSDFIYDFFKAVYPFPSTSSLRRMDVGLSDKIPVRYFKFEAVTGTKCVKTEEVGILLHYTVAMKCAV